MVVVVGRLAVDVGRLWLWAGCKDTERISERVEEGRKDKQEGIEIKGDWEEREVDGGGSGRGVKGGE